VSPTAPTIVTLNSQLNKAHRRIRELQAREAELLSQIRNLCGVITELTHDAHARSAELASSPLATPPPLDGSDRRFGIGAHASQDLGPAARWPTAAGAIEGNL